LIVDRESYQACSIWVPDLDKPLNAIQFQGHYYSLQKTCQSQEEALTVGSRLANTGDAAVVLQGVYGYSVWVLETEARPVM
jgi:hypothetical protein